MTGKEPDSAISGHFSARLGTERTLFPTSRKCIPSVKRQTDQWSWVFGQGPKTLRVKLGCGQGSAGTNKLEKGSRTVSCSMVVGKDMAGMVVIQTGFPASGSQKRFGALEQP